MNAPRPKLMADTTFGCAEHQYGGCANCGAPEEGRLLASRWFWLGGALSVLGWVTALWPQEVRAFLAFFQWPL